MIMGRKPGENLKKSYFIFVELLSFANFDIENCNLDISKTITASSFKLSQLIKNNEQISW